MDRQSLYRVAQHATKNRKTFFDFFPNYFLFPLSSWLGRSVGRSVAWSVGRSVGPLFTLSAFLSFLSIRLLPRCPSDLQHWFCPPAWNQGSRVSGLVTLHRNILTWNDVSRFQVSHESNEPFIFSDAERLIIKGDHPQYQAMDRNGLIGKEINV